MGHAPPRGYYAPPRPAPDRLERTGGWPLGRRRTRLLGVAVGATVLFGLAIAGALTSGGTGFGFWSSWGSALVLVLLGVAFIVYRGTDAYRRPSRASAPDPYAEALSAYLADDSVFAVARFEAALDVIFGLTPTPPGWKGRPEATYCSPDGLTWINGDRMPVPDGYLGPMNAAGPPRVEDLIDSTGRSLIADAPPTEETQRRIEDRWRCRHAGPGPTAPVVLESGTTLRPPSETTAAYEPLPLDDSY